MVRKTQRYRATVSRRFALVALCLPAIAIAPAVLADDAPETIEAQLEFGELLAMQRCGNCHGLAEGDDRFAAPLHHLFGRMPGSIPGYTFSINIMNINTPWTPGTLDNWLEQTTFDTPDIRMRHVGITHRDQRSAVIAYLKSLPGNVQGDSQ